MASINLLHISDLHISKYPYVDQFHFWSAGTWLAKALKDGTFAASHCPSKLRALVLLVDRLRPTLDGIIITGDIATTGQDYDLAQASFLARDLDQTFEH